MCIDRQSELIDLIHSFIDHDDDDNCTYGRILYQLTVEDFNRDVRESMESMRK